MTRTAAKGANTLVQATIFKKCDRAGHKPETNKACQAGTCQHTCEPAQARDCPHKWTVRYSAHSRQREKSFTDRAEAETFQLQLSTDKRTQGQMFVDPRAGMTDFLPAAQAWIDNLATAGEGTKATYRSNFANPEVTRLLTGRSVLAVARMREDVKTLLNKTLGRYEDGYRRTVRLIITGTLDELVRNDTIPRHILGGIELGPQIVTAEEYEARRNKKTVFLPSDAVRALAEGITVTKTSANGYAYPHAMHGLGAAPWLQRTMGLRIREALGVRKADFRERSDGTRYLHLCWQASMDGRTLEPLKHRKAGDYRDIPVPAMVWDMVQAQPDGPLSPGPGATPYLPYNTARNRFDVIASHFGYGGATTHSLRHQFATEALDRAPRELVNISQVLGHASVKTTLETYVHPSANAEQRIGDLMNELWATAPAAPARPGPAGRVARARRAARQRTAPRYRSEPGTQAA